MWTVLPGKEAKQGKRTNLTSTGGGCECHWHRLVTGVGLWACPLIGDIGRGVKKEQQRC